METMQAHDSKRVAVKERDLQRAIIELAELSGWKVYHVGNVKGQLRSRTAVGFPDLILVREGRMLAWELKSAKGRVTKAQEDWQSTLSRVPGVEARVVRPEHWPYIEERLRRVYQWVA